MLDKKGNLRSNREGLIAGYDASFIEIYANESQDIAQGNYEFILDFTAIHNSSEIPRRLSLAL